MNNSMAFVLVLAAIIFAVYLYKSEDKTTALLEEKYGSKPLKAVPLDLAEFEKVLSNPKRLSDSNK